MENSEEKGNEWIVELIEFNDGQKPGGTHLETKIAIYKNKYQSNFFTIFDHLLPDEWCTRAYEYAVQKGSPWGSYITIEEALAPTVVEQAEELWKEGKCEKAIALRAVRALIIDRGGSLIGKDINILHGVAVWSLSSSAKDEVKYHIDYGELYRYETNIIYPPVYAGTCHVSPIYSEEDMSGGAFRANIGGIEHYKKFGYKCRLSSEEDVQKDLQSPQWITVPYLYNRGMLHDGDYPHYSTEILSIKPSIKRVILGFNAFTKELAECNLRAPEHSDAFNRTIKLYQKMAAMGIPVTNAPIDNKYKDGEINEVGEKKQVDHVEPEASNKLGVPNTSEGNSKPKNGINIEDIKKNPLLGKLLVKAAKAMKQNQK